MKIRWMLPAAVLFVAACDTLAGADPGPSAPPAATATAGQRTDVDIATFAAKHAEGVNVIDVRTPGEYASGHVPGAVLVTLDTLDPSAPPLTGYDKDEELYVICQSGRRSAVAADKLAKAGYTVVNVEGGTGEWIAAGHPVEK